MAGDILAVHGIGNFNEAGPQAGAGVLSRSWTRRVRASLAAVAFPRAREVEVEMAYWADLVHELDSAHAAVAEVRAIETLADGDPGDAEPGGGAQGHDVPGHDLLSHGPPGYDAARLDGPVDIEPERNGLTARVERLVSARGEDIAGLLRVAELRELATRWERLRGRPMRARERLAMVAFDEVATYLDSAQVRAACRELVIERLRAVRPTVVIAHSLGSIMAYEALHRADDVPVDLFVTLGSPLGAPASVIPVLDPAPHQGRGSRPPGVGRWVNIADRNDLIPFVQDLAPYFDGIAADLHPTIGPRGSHDAARYLASPVTAAVLAQAL